MANQPLIYSHSHIHTQRQIDTWLYVYYTILCIILSNDSASHHYSLFVLCFIIFFTMMTTQCPGTWNIYQPCSLFVLSSVKTSKPRQWGHKGLIIHATESYWAGKSALWCLCVQPGSGSWSPFDHVQVYKWLWTHWLMTSVMSYPGVLYMLLMIHAINDNNDKFS